MGILARFLSLSFSFLRIQFLVSKSYYVVGKYTVYTYIYWSREIHRPLSFVAFVYLNETIHRSSSSSCRSSTISREREANKKKITIIIVAYSSERAPSKLYRWMESNRFSFLALRHALPATVDRWTISFFKTRENLSPFR